MRNKKLLLQGAGRGNLGLIKTAKDNGVYVVMTGLGGDYPCNPYADKFCQANIQDVDAILKIAQEEKIDGAIICCSDTGLRAIGRCNDILHLSGLSEKSADESSNKLLMKERFEEVGVRTARFYKIRNERELCKASEDLGFPLIVKAVDLQGSRGINIVYEPDKLIEAFQDTMNFSHKEFCIIEEFIEGKEYGAQAFIYNGEVLFILPHGDETLMCKTTIPIGHYVPYNMSQTLYDDTCKQIKLAINALGFNNCAVNVDLIEKNDKAYIIELTGRVGANCLPELTSNYFGINYYEMILATCLGESPLTYWSKRQDPSATVARILRSNKSGIVKSIKIPSIEDATINLFITEGAEVRQFTNCNDAIGEVIVRGKNLGECEKLIERILEEINIEIYNEGKG